ncbi:MAG: hypothetical protein E6G60_20505 [Actinobacteria bacterium]|nr:MAG: hypothetical protein E6G60_20505 [Actinomycetota bacterium]
MERADLTVVAADHDEREVADVVDDVIPCIGDLLFAARHLPRVRPHVLDLESVELVRQVPVARDAGQPEVGL